MHPSNQQIVCMTRLDGKAEINKKKKNFFSTNFILKPPKSHTPQ